MNFMECSHRDVDGPVQTVLKKLVANMRELLKVPDNYHVLFMQGGAHAQFAAAPLNLCGGGAGAESGPVASVDTGFWARRAAESTLRYEWTSSMPRALPARVVFNPRIPTFGNSASFDFSQRQPWGSCVPSALPQK